MGDGTKTDPRRFGPHPDDMLRANTTFQQGSGSGTQTKTLFAAAASGVRTIITSLVISAVDCAIGVEVTVNDGTTAFVVPVPAGGGVVLSNLFLMGAQATAWTVACDKDTGNAVVHVSAIGYTYAG